MYCLNDIDRLSEQQIFEASASHLLTQMQQSKVPDGGCLYRGPNGLKCAAGIFISDEEYPSFPERVWDEAVEHRINENNIQKYNLISDLQDIHDYTQPENWYLTLKKFGLRRELDVTFLEKYNA